MRGFGWIGKLKNLIITHSKPYCDLAEKLADARRENLSLEMGLGIRRIRREYADACSDLERVRGDLDQTVSELADARVVARQEQALRKLSDEKYEAISRENSALKDKLAVSVPLSAIYNMIENSQFAGLYVNSDDCVLFANREASAQIRRQGIKAQITGGSLWEIASFEFMKKLKEDIDSRGSGFKIDYPGIFHCWYVGIARDSEGQLHGYFMSNERGFLRKILGAISSEEDAERKFSEVRGVLIPGRLVGEPGRG